VFNLWWLASLIFFLGYLAGHAMGYDKGAKDERESAECNTEEQNNDRSD